MPGELYLAGAGVARGYLNRPDLTSDRFIPNPFLKAESRPTPNPSQEGDRSQNPKSKIQNFLTSQLPNSLTLYKTGDRVRYRPNGDIEYLRRLDHQVKIRGFRIELGEIESVLHQHPAVAQVVVHPWMDEENQHQQLVAYVVAEDTEETTSTGLRTHLQSRVPDYMVPSTIIVLDALPLTPNGKIDRKSLPVPDRETNTTGKNDEIFQPQTEREEQLAEIWRSLLGLEQVGIHDNFFALGGDSILAIQAIAKARQVGIHLAPKQLFQYQTIAELAALESVEPIQQADQGLVTGTVPLTPIQHWFFEQDFADPHHWNQAIMFESSESLDPQILRQTVQQLLLHHDGLRSQFIKSSHQDTNQWQQVIPIEVPDVVIHIDLTEIPLAQQSAVIEKTNVALQAGFDLATGGLIRIAVFETGQEGQKKTQLLIALHHLLVDGLSWRVILTDLQQLYQTLEERKSTPLSPPLVRGETDLAPSLRPTDTLRENQGEGWGGVPQLPSKSMSLSQWAQVLQGYIQAEAFEQERQYWATIHQQLLEHQKMLPLDFPDGSNRVTDSSTVSVTLTHEETDALLHQVPNAYQTQINDVLLAALLMGLTDWTKTDSLALELEGHGREFLTDGVDLSRTVGWLTTLFPVVLNRVQFDELGIILKSVKEQLRDIPNRGIGYGLWRYLDSGHTSPQPSPWQGEGAEPPVSPLAFRGACWKNAGGLRGVNAGTQATSRQAQSLSSVRFNYLGQTDALWSEGSLLKPSSLSAGPLRSPRGDRGVILEINGLVTGGCLRLDWSYSNGLHRRETVQQVAVSVMTWLRQLIDYCCAPEAGGYTPSDFPEMALSQGELDDLLADL